MKKQRGRKRIEEVTYCAQILWYHVSYSFALPPTKDIVAGPYWEHTDMTVRGKLIHPEKFRDRELDMSFLGDRSIVDMMLNPMKYRGEPIAVGQLIIWGDESRFLGSIPFDAVQFLCSLMESGRIKYVMLNGPQLYRGRSAIRSLYFEQEFVPEDW